MAVDKKKIIIPGHGAAFWSAVNTPVPTVPTNGKSPLESFSLAGTAPSPWTNLGHTSKDNLVSLTRDGGDVTKIDSWLEDNIAEIREATSMGVEIKAIQLDPDSLDLAFNGDGDLYSKDGYSVPSTTNPLAVALFLLIQDPSGRKLGFYFPNCTIALGDAPEFDAEKPFELPLTASVLSADESVLPAVNGISTSYKMFAFDPNAA